MTAVKKGDRVRVVLEGTAHEPYRGSGTDWAFYLNDSTGHPLGVVYSESRAVSVEVLKPKLKVGDTVEGRDAYARLPIGTHLADSTERGVSDPGELVRVADGYFNVRSGQTKTASYFVGAREIVYLPASA